MLGTGDQAQGDHDHNERPTHQVADASSGEVVNHYRDDRKNHGGPDVRLPRYRQNDEPRDDRKFEKSFLEFANFFEGNFLREEIAEEENQS